MEDDKQVKQIGNIELKDTDFNIIEDLTFYLKNDSPFSIMEMGRRRDVKTIRYLNGQGCPIAYLALLTQKRALEWRSWESLICELITRIRSENDDFNLGDVVEALRDMKV